MDSATLFKNTQIHIERFDDGDAVILDDEKQFTHMLNITALQIYDLCDGRSRDKTVEELLEMYREDIKKDSQIRMQIITDANELIYELLEKGILYEKQNGT